MKLLLGFKTARGPVFIAQSRDGRFHPIWAGESLGSYPNTVGAIDDVAGGHTYSPSDGTDLDSLEISRDIGEWEPAANFM